MASNKLHILTLNYNGLDKLEQLYGSKLFEALSDLDHKWYVKDNGSTDGSLEYLNRLSARSNVFVVATKHNNDSFAKGCNVLFDYAKPDDNDLVLLLNNDIVINDIHSLSNMVGLIKDLDIGIVGAKLTYPNNTELQHAGVIFDRKYNLLPFHYRPHEREDDNAKKNREFQALTGAVMLTRASIYKQLNGLNEDYHWCFEDIDYCLRAKYKLNKKVVYCGQTNISHQESATLKKNPVHKLFMEHNVKTFLKNWQGKYQEDHHFYLKDPEYNLYKGTQ